MLTCFLVFCLHLLTPSAAAALESDTYVVHMDNTKIKLLSPSYGNPGEWYQQILNSISTSSQHQTSHPQILYVYQNAISGFSARLSKEHLKSLRKVDGFLSATRDELLPLHTTHSPTFLGLQEKKGLWSNKNLASDVIIGVVDTGIWPEHPSFRAAGLSPVPSRWRGKCQSGPKFAASKCNRKLIGAGAFFKGYETLVGRINETLDYRSARDSQGHGTHTASTAGGNLVQGASFFGLAKGKAAGMRYTARIAAYKACYQFGCTSSDILAAVEQAVGDGVDILSLSLGGAPKPYFIDNIAIGAFGAVKKGVIVSFSAGNSGPGSSTVGNVAPWMVTVGASYTDRSFLTKIRLGDGRVFSGASLYSGKDTKSSPVVYGETREAKFCITNSLVRKHVKGKIVICDRGINSRVAKGETVKTAGGAGMILANDVSQGEELFADAHVLPATSLGATASKALKIYANISGNSTAAIGFKGAVYGNRAPVMAAFSSRGPSSVGPDIIKPDVTAPGVNILAAWPTNISPTSLGSDKRRGFFNVVSGTSMSCPHVAGIIALVKSVHEDWSPAAIKSALMTTAYVRDSRNSGISDVGFVKKTATPFAFGSGHVDPERAADPGLVYNISTGDYLNYLCSLNYNSTQMKLFGGGDFACRDGLESRPGDLNYPSFAVVLGRNSNSTVTYGREVTNVGAAVSRYTVRVIEPKGVSVSVEPEVLEFRKVGERVRFKVSLRVRGDVVVSESSGYSFGSLTWVYGKYSVRSPVAVTWLV